MRKGATSISNKDFTKVLIMAEIKCISLIKAVKIIFRCNIQTLTQNIIYSV